LTSGKSELGSRHHPIVPASRRCKAPSASSDIKDRTISVFQARYDPQYPPEAVLHQYKHLGVAPGSA
jgi:hypothetical protein